MGSKVFFLIWCGMLSSGISIKGQPTSDAGKKVVMRYFDEVLNKRKLQILPEIFAHHYLFRKIEDGSKTRGIQQLQEFLPYLFRAFPDLRYTVTTLVEENGNFALQANVTGTHKDEFWGFAPSNKKINVAEIFFFKVREGKIVECSRLLDFNTLKYQLTATDKDIDPVREYLAEKMLLD